MPENNDMVSITRQFLTFARSESKSGVGSLVTGLPQEILDRLSLLDIGQIESLSRTVGISLFSFRLDIDELDKLLAISEQSRAAYALSLVTSPKREQRFAKKRVGISDNAGQQLQRGLHRNRLSKVA